jgi:hypothetical protein
MGGHQVVWMPNKTTALRFARNGSPSPEVMVAASNDVIPVKDVK